jgi:hypothetical protein
LIKQLWPVIKTKVKDPNLLMSTINQCVAPINSDNPIVPLINDIELLSSKDIQQMGDQ